MTTGKRKTAGKTGKAKLNKLNEAAFKIVEKDPGKIARALAGAVAKGNVMSMKLLIGLAKEFVDAEQAEVLGPFHDLLVDLAAEPEWPADAAEAVKRARAGKTDS